MTTLDSTADQVFDKLADLVTGPVCGTLAATATSDVWVPQGQLATLADGRRVRVRKATYVTETSTAVPVRLEWLSPSYPAARNYNPVPNGTAATWLSPVAGLDAAATTNEFASGTRASGLLINSVVEHDRIANGGDLFGSGAQGTSSILLLDPEVTPIGGEQYNAHQYFDVKWSLRVNLATFEPKKDATARARSAFDALCASLLGSTCGDDVVRFGQWRRVAKTEKSHSWELQFFTRLAAAGRPSYDAGDATFDEVGVTITIPRDDEQDAPFRIEDEITV